MLAGLALMLGARCLPAAEPAAAPQPQDLFLEVTVNGEASGQVVGFRQGPHGLVANLTDLRQLGLDLRSLIPRATGEVELDAVPGLRYEYDAARQAISLQADDAMRTPFQVNARHAADIPQPTATPGAVFNYNASLQLNDRPTALVATDWRLFNQRGALSTSGLATVGARGAGFLRYDTFWSESDAETLRTTQFGDTVSSSLPWNRAVRIGGVQWSKSFALRPDLLTFPMPSIGGSAQVPSALSLYVNGVQQYSTNVPGGPFVIDQVAGINGAGNAVVVTRDAFGRSTSMAVPLYVDMRMLAPGLSDYSLEAGLPRRDYGIRSFGYQRTLVASGSGRIGMTQGLTLEGHAELAPRLLNAGAGALVALGRAGVANANIGASAGSLAGVQASAGYQYVAPRLSVNAQVMRASPHYGDLAARDGNPAPTASAQLSLAFSLPGNLSVSGSYIAYRSAQAPPARIVAAGLTRTIGDGLFVSVSAFRDMARPGSSGAFISVSMALGERVSASATMSHQNGALQRSMNVVSAPDTLGGAGWSVQNTAVGEVAYRRAQWLYLGNAGQFGATVQSGDVRSTASLDAAGALVVMDGTAALTRRVGEGFAMVSTGGVAGVPVLYENRVVGVTDAGGHLLVPQLNVNGSNHLAIDASGLDADARVRETARALNPRRLSGVLALFPVERYHAANVMLVDAQGAPLPVGLRVLHVESGNVGMTGYDGLAFIDDLRASNRLEVGEGSQRCAVAFADAAVAGEMLPVIGPLRCVASEALR